METKTLKLQGSPGKLENQYVMTVSVPGKIDLLSMIEKPPFHIFSKDDTTYSTGILAHVPHSLKMRISRDYQEPFVGLYIKISSKTDEIIEVAEVKGAFVITPPTKTPGISSAPKDKTDAALLPRSQTSSSHNMFYQNGERNNICVSNNIACISNAEKINGSTATDHPHVIYFNFFKNSVSKLLDLENYDYYESRCQWPDVASQLDLYVKVAKTTCSFLVNEDNSFNGPKTETAHSVATCPYFLSKTYSDVTIYVGESVFPAHKIILSERSRYFSRMFANSMRETTEGIVRISEEDDSLFREMLRFMYQGTVEDLEENASELFIISDKYDVPELTTFCEKYLLKQLNVDKAMEMFDLSQSILMQGQLAKKSKELIMWNRDKFASDLQAFKDFSRKYPEIIFELLQL